MSVKEHGNNGTEMDNVLLPITNAKCSEKHHDHVYFRIEDLAL